MLTVQGITFIAGAIFILIAIIGGGFTARGFTVPKIPKSGRICSAVIGVLLVCYSLLPPLLSGSARDDFRLSPSHDAPGMDTIHADDQSYLAEEDGIEVSNFVVKSEHDPPQVNDPIEVQFTLRNSGARPVTLEYIFVAVDHLGVRYRDLDGLGQFEANETLEPGEEVSFAGMDILGKAGKWTFWPCYRFAKSLEGEGYCPPYWQAFSVDVESR